MADTSLDTPAASQPHLLKCACQPKDICDVDEDFCTASHQVWRQHVSYRLSDNLHPLSFCTSLYPIRVLSSSTTESSIGLQCYSSTSVAYDLHQGCLSDDIAVMSCAHEPSEHATVTCCNDRDFCNDDVMATFNTTNTSVVTPGLNNFL